MSMLLQSLVSPMLVLRPSGRSQPHAGGANRDGLMPGPRRAVIVVILALHALVLSALWQREAIREAVRESMVATWIVPTTPVAPVALPEPVRAPATEPIRTLVPKVERVVRPSPESRPISVPAAVPREAALPVASPPAPSSLQGPSADVAPTAPSVAQAPVEPPTPAAPPPPAVLASIPPSSVQWLVEPAPDYPRLAQKAGEVGRVMVRVLVDTAGIPHDAQIAKSSGFARLDAAALVAVQRARFRPPTIDGRPVTGWTNVPIDFALER